jgi:hypothetical protein
MHFPEPQSRTLGGVLRWIATTLFLLLGGTIVEENIRHLAEEKHWNEFLTGALKVLPDLAPVMETHWFWFIFGLVSGIAGSLWIAWWILPPRSGSAKEPSIDYAHSLAFQGLQHSLDTGNSANTYEVRLILRNTSAGPVKYRVEKYECTIDSIIVKATHAMGNVISKDGIGAFYPNIGYSKGQYAALKDRSTGTLELTIAYGHPDKPPCRRLYKLLRLDFFKKKKTLNWTVLNESDEPIV